MLLPNYLSNLQTDDNSIENINLALEVLETNIEVNEKMIDDVWKVAIVVAAFFCLNYGLLTVICTFHFICNYVLVK